MKSYFPKPEKLLYTAKEAQQSLSISARKLWSMTASGEIKHVRCGRCVRYDIADIREFIESNKKGGDVR